MNKQEQKWFEAELRYILVQAFGPNPDKERIYAILDATLAEIKLNKGLISRWKEDWKERE